MKKIKLFLLVAVMSLGTGAIMQAQTKASKIAHISTQELVQEMPQYQSAQSQLQKLEKTYRTEIEDMMKEMKSMTEKFKSQADTSTEKQNMSRSKELQSTRQRVMKYRQDAQKRLQKKEGELIQPIIEKARSAIQKVARDKGYDYVLDASEGASNVLLADGYDLMPDVKKELGI
jgi:outer membrane protein